MTDTLPNTNIFKQEFSYGHKTTWMTSLEDISRTFNSLYLDVYSEPLMGYTTFAELYRTPDFRDRSALMRLDFRDGIKEEENSSANDEIFISSTESTGVDDINKANQEYLDYLRSRTEEIAISISHTVFDDGMDNDVTLLIKSFAKKNKSVTYNWLNELYSKNLNNPIVIHGILRSIAMITELGDENVLLPIVVASLRSDNSLEQEAAIMVVEEWRTKECLDAICSVPTFSSKIITDYANMVKEELKEELGVC